MATEGGERFLRSSYLLLKGTFYLAKKVLIREAENVHQQTGRDLDGLLNDNEQKLKHEFRHKTHRKKLFPTNGKTNVEDWDISLLIGVLLIVFRNSLPDKDRKAIKKIKYQRNEVYAHCHEASLDKVDYTDTCSDLEDAFNTLTLGFGVEVKQECDAIIQTCLNGALDHKSHVEHLKQLAEKDDLLLEILAKIETTGKEIINDLKNTFKVENAALKSDITQDIPRSENNLCNTVRDYSKKQREELRAEVLEAVQQALQGQHRIKVVDSQLDICGTDQDQDNIALAEKIIVTVTNEAVRRAKTCEEFTHIREIIQEILDEITSQTGLKPILAAKEPKVQREYKKSVHLPIQIESVEGIKRALDLFEGGGLTNNLQKLSEALTKKVGAKINVKPSINMKQLKEALQDFDPVKESAIHIGKTEEYRSEEGAATGRGYGQSHVDDFKASYIHRDDRDTGKNKALERDEQLLNNCFDDIETFVLRLNQATEAYKELERHRGERGWKRKQKSAGDCMLMMRARQPPADDFIDIFQKFKFAFNLLAKWKAHFHDPSAQELVHFMFTPLSFIYEASRDPIHGGRHLSSEAVAPLLLYDAKQLLLNCLSSKELEIWQRLGHSWTKVKDEWHASVPPYNPRFYNDWQPSPQLVDEVKQQDRLRDEPLRATKESCSIL